MLIRIVLAGLSGPITVAGLKYDMEMPAFSFLTDEQVADVVTYVRASFGQKTQAVSKADVARIRNEVKK